MANNFIVSAVMKVFFITYSLYIISDHCDRDWLYDKWCKLPGHWHLCEIEDGVDAGATHC